MKRYVVQEWNKYSGWYDMPDANPTRSWTVVSRIYRDATKGNFSTSGYRYRIITRFEEVMKLEALKQITPTQKSPAK